jgi:sensor histidine kinase YesM
MKKLVFLTLTLLSVLISAAQKPIVIKGRIENCPNQNTSYIQKRWFNNETLKDESKDFNFSIAADGTFRVKITETDDYYVRYWIHLGYEHTHLDLIAGDSIYMTLNGASFDESIKYSGKGAGRNNYRRDVFLQFWEWDVVSSVNYKYEPDIFLVALNALTDRKLDLLNRYFSTGEIDSSYYSFEKSIILDDRAYQVVNHNERYHNHKKASGNIAREFKSIIDAVDFTNDHLLQHSYFKYLVQYLPAYVTETGSGKNAGNLNDEMAYAKAHYTTTMYLYWAQSLIQNQLGEANNLGEKRALLSYFSQQFAEPVLQKEIQRQSSSFNSNAGIDSNLSEAIVVSVLSILGFAVILFLIFRLLKITSFRNTNINLSLWLKVVFYLAASVASWAYIGHTDVYSKAFVGVLLWIGAFVVHTYLLIPRYALGGNRIRYFQALFVAFVACLLGLYLSEQFATFAEYVLVTSLLWGAIVMLSWTSHYIQLLVSRKTTLKGLTKNGDLNIEVAVNVALLYLVNLVFIAGINYDQIFTIGLPFYFVVFLFYFHAFYSFPRYFSKEKAIHFAGTIVATLVVASVGMVVLDAFQSRSALQELGIDKSLFDLFSLKNIRADILLLFTAVLIPSFVYHTIKERFRKLDTAGFSLYRKKEAELAQLKAQVNPHFLFNTLNTLYAFALKEGSEKTAECIAKLANLMRFLLDDMEKESILLQREVSYIQDYVKLQSIRSAVEHDITLSVDIEDEQSYSIAPMLLIPFVENAFKHGMNPNKVSRLKIDIMGKGSQIQFVIENSIDENFEAYYKERGFGIGIENVKSRLKYIYPNRHNISIAKTNGKFIVILTIDIL